MKSVRANQLIGIVNSYIIDSPTTSNISYLWNIGSMLAVVLVLQLITGITLAFYYTGSISEAFNSVEHIDREIWYGSLIRYLHSNGAALFFILVYLHIGKAIYYGSYKGPRIALWNAGILIFIIMMATAFLGYTLPFGSMSYWGATVITSLFSAIPLVGDHIVVLLWGGFSINNGTLSRFYALHFILPFILLAVVIIHILILHRTTSNNPLGITSNSDTIPFHPYYIYKDLLGFITLFLLYFLLILYQPQLFGHPDNFIPADPLVTPLTIVPEFYFQPYYAILRSIPFKLLGVIGMLYGIIVLFQLPYNYHYHYQNHYQYQYHYHYPNPNPNHYYNLRCNTFRPLGKTAYWIFTANFILLTWLGGETATSLNVILSQISSGLYFAYLLCN